MQHQTFRRPVSLVCIAAQADTAFLAQWETHLLPLKQAGLITFWSERHLLAGANRLEQLSIYLDQTECILLLLSADFFANDECIAFIERALSRQRSKSIVIVPLLLRPVEWQESALGSFLCLPTTDIPITQWPSQDEAFHVCVRELRSLLNLPLRPTRVAMQEKALSDKNRERMLRRLRRSYHGLLA